MDSFLSLVDNCFGGMVRQLLESLPPPVDLITEEGEFKEADFKNFLRSVKLEQNGGSCAIVAIMGPQSSGKSTLMNHLFHTNFEEMNAHQGRRRVTKGIWIAKAPLMKPFTMVLDLEGTDGLERGEDDTSFERQSALFALAVADVLIINVWCKDIGLVHAANRPLRTIFEVMLRFGPNTTTLVFALRDKTMTPVDKLESSLRENVDKIWEAILKPPGHEDTPLSDIFNVEVTVLPNYEENPYIFKKEVSRLRSRFINSILLSPKRGNNNNDGDDDALEVMPFKDAKKIWDEIKRCKDLDLPSHKVMVATVRCQEIAEEKLMLFASNKDWSVLHKEATAVLVSDFSARAKAILDIYLSEYDSECMRYEKDVSDAKREYLKSEASKIVRPAYMNTLGHRRSNALQGFKTRLEAALKETESVRICQESCVLQFDKQCDSDGATFSSDVSTVRHELLRDIEHHWDRVRDNTLLQIEQQQRERLSRKFTTKLRNFLCDPNDEDIWGRIRDLVRSESDAAALVLSSAVAKLGLDTAKVVDDLKQKARELMVKTLEHEIEDIQGILKQRFITAFMNVNGSVGIDEELINDAYRKCVKLLSSLTVIRFDESDDNVESVLLSTLMGTKEISPDPLASQEWEEVPPNMTLIKPVRCREIWNQFKPATGELYPTARLLEEECVKAKHWQPPTWVIMGLLAVGCVAVVGIIRFTNIDVLLALGIAVNGIGIAVKAMGIVQEGMDNYKKIPDNRQDDFIGFWRRHRNILKTIKQALRKFCKFMNTVLGKRETVEVAA